MSDTTEPATVTRSTPLPTRRQLREAAIRGEAVNDLHATADGPAADETADLAAVTPAGTQPGASQITARPDVAADLPASSPDMSGGQPKRARRSTGTTTWRDGIHQAIQSISARPGVRPGFVAREVHAAVRRHLGTAIAIIVTATLALAMLGGGLLVRAQIDGLKGAWYDTTQVAVYLTHDITDTERTHVETELDTNNLVAQVWFEDQELAYKNFATQFASSPDLVAEVTPDQMPESFRIKLLDPNDGEQLVDEIGALPGVRQVVDEHAQLATLFDVLTGFQRAALLLAGIQALAAVVLISNMVRSNIVLRARELEVGRTMGASRAQLSVPFAAEVAFYGLLGVGFSVGLLAVAKVELIDQRLASSGILSGVVGFVGWDALWGSLPWLLLAGVGVPVAVTWLLLRRRVNS